MSRGPWNATAWRDSSLSKVINDLHKDAGKSWDAHKHINLVRTIAVSHIPDQTYPFTQLMGKKMKWVFILYCRALCVFLFENKGYGPAAYLRTYCLSPKKVFAVSSSAFLQQEKISNTAQGKKSFLLMCKPDSQGKDASRDPW